MALQPVHTLSSDTLNQDHPRLASQAAYCFSTRGVLTLLCEPIHLSLLESSLINHSHTWAWALPVAWKLFGVSAKMLTKTSAYSMLLSSFGANSNRSVYSTGGLNKRSWSRGVFQQRNTILGRERVTQQHCHLGSLVPGMSWQKHLWPHPGLDASSQEACHAKALWIYSILSNENYCES